MSGCSAHGPAATGCRGGCPGGCCRKRAATAAVPLLACSLAGAGLMVGGCAAEPPSPPTVTAEAEPLPPEAALDPAAAAEAIRQEADQ